jgi:hypothetical protein
VISDEEREGVGPTDTEAESPLGVGVSMTRRGEDVAKQEDEEGRDRRRHQGPDRPPPRRLRRAAPRPPIDPNDTESGGPTMPAGTRAGSAVSSLPARGPGRRRQAAWPRLMPASLGGTREWVRTRIPFASRPATVRSSSSMFWKTPPDRATVPRPVSWPTAWQAVTVAAARPLWKRAAISGGGTPADSSATTARTRSAPPSRSSPSPAGATRTG